MKANGFASVLMLIALLSVGAVLSLQSSPGSLQLGMQAALDERQSRLRSLAQAKQSLLHYTSTYNDLYGPGGSGPGHLPCPDTDAYRRSSGQSESGSPFVGDSPDPPCGNGRYTMGYLPRHVSLVDTRYAFHTEFAQTIWYELATSHVNNPSNRVVNAASVQLLNRNRLVARLVSPPSDALQEPDEIQASLANANSDEQRSAHPPDDFVMLPLTESEILAVSTRRVHRWFADTYRHSRERSCSEYDRCGAVPERVIRCTGANLPETLSLSSTLFWLLADTEESTCTMRELESVSLSRHWFVRNQWFEAITITIHDDCMAAHYSECQLIRDEEHALKLLPVS